MGLVRYPDRPPDKYDRPTCWFDERIQKIVRRTNYSVRSTFFSSVAKKFIRRTIFIDHKKKKAFGIFFNLKLSKLSNDHCHFMPIRD